MDRAKTDILHRTFPIVTPKVINKHGRGVSINTMPNSQTKTLQVIKPSKEVLGKETDEISHKKLIETFIKTTSPVTNTDSKHLNSTKENEKHRYSTTKQNSNFQERNKRKSKTMVIKTQKKQIDLCDIMQQQIQKAFKNIRNQNVPLSKKSVFLMEKLNDVTLQDGPSPTVAKEACKTVGHLRLVGNQIQPQYKELNDTMPRVNPPSVLAEEVRTMDQNPVKSQNTSPTVIRVKKFGIYDKMKNRRLSFRQDTPTYYRMKKLKDPELVNNQRSPLTNQVISSQKNPENDINIRPLCNNPLPNEIEASAIFKNDSKKRDILSSSVEQIVKNQVKKGPLLPSRIPISGRNKNVVVKQYTPIDLKKIEIRNRKAIQRLVNNQWRPFVSESNVKEIEVSPKIVAPNKTKVGSSKIVSPHFANRGVYSANIRMDATQTPRIPTNNIQANFKETQSYDEIPAVNKSGSARTYGLKTVDKPSMVKKNNMASRVAVTNEIPNRTNYLINQQMPEKNSSNNSLVDQIVRMDEKEKIFIQPVNNKSVKFNLSNLKLKNVINENIIELLRQNKAKFRLENAPNANNK